MSFLSSLYSILYGFMKAYIKSFENQISGLFSWIGQQIEGYFLFWGNSFSSDGILIPSMIAVILGITMMGLFAVFFVFDGARSLIGGD